MLNFVAAEHIDWSAGGPEDINDGRIAVTGVTQHQASIDHDQLLNFNAAEHFTEASITHNNIGGRTAADTHPTSAITGLDAALASKLENVADDLAPALGGYLDIKANGFEQILTAAAGNTFSAGQVGVAAAAGMVLADASAESTSAGKIALALEAVPAGNTGRFALLGTQVNAAGATTGAALYLTTTPGVISETRPTGSGEVVRVVGRTESASFIFFDPSADWLVLA